MTDLSIPKGKGKVQFYPNPIIQKTVKMTPKLVILLILSVFTQCLMSQTMFLPQDNKHLPFLERLEIMLQKNPDLNIASPKTITRHVAVNIAGLEDSSSGSPILKFSKVDLYNLQSLLTNNAEYVNRDVPKLGIFSTFYNNPANMLEVNKPKFFMALNPVIGAQYAYEKDNDDPVYLATAGLSFRTLINNNLGFYAYATRNMESPPTFVRNRIMEFNAVPGAGHFNLSGNRYNYYDLRGGVTFKALKYFDFQIAYDRNFIGNGYRSLFLSEYGPNYLFGKVNTRVWKFKYQHIYASMVPQYGNDPSPVKPFGRKVMAIHHLSINATKWLNLALFQSISINNRKQWPYLAPIMFYPVSQLTDTKADNDITGFEFKANVAKRAQFYGQLLIDNLELNKIKKADGWWNNRFGVQLGAKYINALSIKNLDLQVEMNAVRPYTYSTQDSLGNYTNYNQPLSHPFGANFMEAIGIVKYQPTKKITTTLRAIVWQQGMDTANLNFGSSILKGYRSRLHEFGYTIPSGLEATGLNLQLLFTYEIDQNIFFDASFNIRKMQFENSIMADRNTVLIAGNLRINLFRKEYNY